MKIQMKTLALCLGTALFIAVKPACATLSGPYIGGQLGWGYVHQGEFIAYYLNKAVSETIPYSTTEPINIFFRDTGIAERVFLGFQFNRYLAAEVGYYRFKNINVNLKVNADITLYEEKGWHLPLTLATNVSVRTEVFDLMAKVMLPLTDKFSLYGKLGLAYVDVAGSATVGIETPVGNIGLSTNPTVNVVYPAFALGLNYDLTQHASADFSWTRIQKVNPCPFPSIDFIAVGLLYHF